jgi:predicted nucleotidyltransferase
MGKLALTDQQQDDIRVWAAGQPAILRMWAIGSRANGTSGPNSDLDLTVELYDPHDGHPYGLSTLVFERAKWCDELSSLTGLEVKDIQLEFDPQDCCCGKGRSEGVLLYP